MQVLSDQELEQVSGAGYAAKIGNVFAAGMAAFAAVGAEPAAVGCGVAAVVCYAVDAVTN